MYNSISKHYNLGIERWEEFLKQVRDIDDNLSKKSYLLKNGFIKFQDASEFTESVKTPNWSAELEKLSETHINLTNLGDQLCISCEDGCQDFIQNTLTQLGKHIE